MTLQNNQVIIELSLPELKAQRDHGPLQNDVYEAIDDRCHLAQSSLRNDTRVNYPARANSELLLLEKLRAIVLAARVEDREKYLPLLNEAEEMLHKIAQIPLPADGHLRVLKTIRKHFSFLFDDYGFGISDERPTGMRLSSRTALVELGWATQSTLSFRLGRNDECCFWIEDLLFLYDDGRYRSVPQAIELNIEEDVDSWFQFVAGVLRQYGDELLTDQPRAFDRLAKAQADRDAEFVGMMNAANKLSETAGPPPITGS